MLRFLAHPLFARLGTPLLLVLIVTGFFWKVLTKQFTWMDHPDMAYQILPWYQFQAVLWHRGEFPLWDPNLWAGQPLLAQIVPSGAYPLNWLLFLMPLRDGHIQWFWLHLQFVMTHCMGALFCYALCRDLKRSRAASLFGGAAFSLGGLVGTVAWPQMLNGAIWTPLVMLFFLRSERGERPVASAVLSGTFLGVAFLSGHHQVPIFIALLMAGLWVWALVRERLSAAVLWRGGAFAVFVFLCSALQTLPAYEFGLRAVRWVGSQNPVFWSQYVPYSVHENNSLYPLALVNLVLPSGVHGREDVFLGIVIVVMALAAMAAWFAQSNVRLFGAMAVAVLVFALGGVSIYQGVAYMFVPMVEKARSPYMSVFLMQFAVIMLAVFGLDAWREAITRESAWSQRCVWILAGTGVASWLFLAAVTTQQEATTWRHERVMLLGLMAIALAALLHGWRGGHLSQNAAISLLILLVLFELGTVSGRSFKHREAPATFLAKLDADRDVTEFLRHQISPFRVEIDTDAVPYNIGDWEGIETFRSFGAGLTSNLAPFEDDRLKGGTLAPKLLSLGYYLSTKPRRPQQELVFSGKSGVNVYRNPEAFPRVWAVHEVAKAESSALLQQIRAEESPLRKKAWITTDIPRLETCTGEDEVRMKGEESARVQIEAKLPCQGMVILSETYFPGWVATVDGQAARIYEAYGMIRGVVVPAGAHEIEMRYRPATVYWGAALTAVGLLAACWMAIGKIGRA